MYIGLFLDKSSNPKSILQLSFDLSCTSTDENFLDMIDAKAQFSNYAGNLHFLSVVYPPGHCGSLPLPSITRDYNKVHIFLSWEKKEI